MREKNNEYCKTVRQIQKKYASGLKLDYLNLEEDFFSHLKQLNEEDIDKHLSYLLLLTLDEPHFVKYPVKNTYREAFLKLLIQRLESIGLTHEGVYEKFVQNLKIQSSQETYFKHYLLNDSFISIKVNNNIISQGTTGLSTWQAGIGLANWGIRHKELFTNKKVLELGSGTGLTGLALIKTTFPSTFVFSDFHPVVLDQLRFNVNLNLKQNNVQVLNLDWDKVSDFDPNFKPEIVIAADVVYDISILPGLSRTLSYFIDTTDKIGVIACKVRNEDTLKEFIKIISTTNLVASKEKIDFDLENDTFITDKCFDSPVQIFTLRLKNFCSNMCFVSVLIMALKNNEEQGKIDLLVFGYACKLFRDDEKALMIDNGSHLIPWMGEETLKIDRYDGRGNLFDLTSHEPKADYNYTLTEEEESIEQFCDKERYRSLYINEEEEIFYREEIAKRTQKKEQEYSEVAYNYDVPNYSNEVGAEDAPSKPFVPLPELKLPPDMKIPETVKHNAIVERTALFLAQQGPQMEILMKVKQQGNRFFNFLSHTDPLHRYYLHLKALIKSGSYVPKEQISEEEMAANQGDLNNLKLSNPTQSIIAESKIKTIPLKITPPEHIQRIIATMVKYVIKNGNRFENAIIKRGDVRFSFLNPKHIFNTYYQEELKKKQATPKESKESGKKRKPVPVCFSIKKPKENESLEVSSALPMEESSDSGNESPRHRHDDADHSLEKRMRRSSRSKRSREKKDVHLQNERKMKAAQFLKDLKRKGT